MFIFCSLVPAGINMNYHQYILITGLLIGYSLSSRPVMQGFNVMFVSKHCNDIKEHRWLSCGWWSPWWLVTVECLLHRCTDVWWKYAYKSRTERSCSERSPHCLWIIMMMMMMMMMLGRLSAWFSCCPWHYRGGCSLIPTQCIMFWCSSRMWQTDGWTDKQMDRLMNHHCTLILCIASQVHMQTWDDRGVVLWFDQSWQYTCIHEKLQEQCYSSVQFQFVISYNLQQLRLADSGRLPNALSFMHFCSTFYNGTVSS